jgi:hypothetical protein
MNGFRDQFNDPKTLPGLPGLSALIGEVRHMCPENCVMPDAGVQVANLFCPVCLGAGSITTERLDRWQTDQNIKAIRGEL